MYNITVNGTQSFMGYNIPVVLGGFGADAKCISDETIAELHGIKPYHIREVISRNADCFKNNIDIINMKGVVVQNGNFTICSQLGYSRMEVSKAKSIYILFEHGYATLVKIMGGMDTWDIHDRLADEYFSVSSLSTSNGVKNLENALSVTGTQLFMGKEIPVVSGGFGQDKRCISDKTIAEIHKQPASEIRKSIGRNISRFRLNIDYIDLKRNIGSITGDEITGNNILNMLGYTKAMISHAEHIYILSERGYAKLIKIMDTDLAWEIHDRLVDEYFEMRERLKNDFSTLDLSPQLQILYSLVDNLAKTEIEQKRQAEALKAVQMQTEANAQKLDNIKEVISLSTENWREECRKLIALIAQKRGNDYKGTYSECFDLVDKRAGVSLKRRLDNRRKRMTIEGVSKTNCEQFSHIDVIAEDKKLVEVYLAVVKDMAIKYGVEEKIA